VCACMCRGVETEVNNTVTGMHFTCLPLQNGYQAPDTLQGRASLQNVCGGSWPQEEGSHQQFTEIEGLIYRLLTHLPGH
jgi:hypothetical protein